MNKSLCIVKSRAVRLSVLIFAVLLMPFISRTAAASQGIDGNQLRNHFLVTDEQSAPDLQTTNVLPPLPTSLPAERPSPFAGWPDLTSEGFLKTEERSLINEFVYADEKDGVWAYVSPALRIEINRVSARFERRDLIWFMADIRFKSPEAFRAYSANPNFPGKGMARPEAIAKQHSVVYAQNGDLFSFRVSNKERTGIIIRDGKILHEHTYTRAHAVIPPLDELSLYPDGHIEMHTPGVLNGQDYLTKGATDVLAFGPILFKERIKDERLDKSFTSLEPRSALGIIGPGHFVGIMVEGRNKRSGGAPLRFVADRLLEAGCYEAFTLDGGQTAAMMFMGRNVMDPGYYSGYHKTRSQPDIVGIGLSPAVPKK